MKNLKQIRKERGLTLEQVASEIGVRHSSISMWENGKSSPRLEHLQALARHYNVRVSDLLGEERAA